MLACSGQDAKFSTTNGSPVLKETGFSTHKKDSIKKYIIDVKKSGTSTISVSKLSLERSKFSNRLVRESIWWMLKSSLPSNLNLVLEDRGRIFIRGLLRKSIGENIDLRLSPLDTILPRFCARGIDAVEAEWGRVGRAQRESVWNKAWRKVDARNFYNSLNHKGANFKGNSKKLVTPDTLEPNYPSPLIASFALTVATDMAPPPTWVGVDNSEGAEKVTDAEGREETQEGYFLLQ
jgi:hypothetical protein